MEFKTKVGFDGIKEVQKAAYPKKAEILVHVICGAFLALAVYQLFNQSFLSAVIYVIGAGAVEFILYRGKNRAAKLMRSRLTETGASELRYHCVFGEEKLSITNLVTEGKTELLYSIFARYVETAHYALLITKSRQMVILELEQAQRYQVKEFLRSKNPAIK